MQKLFILALLPILAATADAQGVRDLLSRPTCPAGGCPSPAATAQPVRAVIAQPVAVLAKWVAPTTSSDGWYPGKLLDRMAERRAERKAARQASCCK